MQQLKLVLHGTRPLIQHNVRLVDPLDPYTQALRTATDEAKAKKTDEAHRHMADVEFEGSLYHDDELGPYVKAEAVERCLRQAAAIGFKGYGAKVERGVLITGMDNSEAIPLLYNGPRDIETLRTDPNYRLRAAVGVGQNKVMRTRPRFRNWSIECMAHIDESQINTSRFREIALYAGRLGLGDHRPRYGRFEAEVEK